METGIFKKPIFSGTLRSPTSAFDFFSVSVESESLTASAGFVSADVTSSP